MKKSYLLFFILIILAACKKEEDNDIAPIISLSTEETYTYTDTEAPPGEQIKVGILATSNSGGALTNIIIKSNNERIVDEGINTSLFSKDYKIVKTNEEVQKLIFIIRNINGLSDSISFNLNKGEGNYGPIILRQNITLGAQNNSTENSFYSISENKTYSIEEAYNSQTIIDLCYFYETNGDLNALGSPGANLTEIFTGTYAPDKWTTKNTYRFSRTPIELENKDLSSYTTDQIIVSNIFTDSGRKAKQLKTGDVYAFFNDKNKYGIVKINSVSGTNQGTINIDLIIQE